ncbi:hypothetical protein DTO169E5_4865 [Paecilomyces variotii]|nr:hypothetical protein DTO169E5_4865 [Paecilomyces variotii]KAJ9380471.1 hypothetical protein DTO063F5_6668 [Paecilomyces variotii]
MGSVVLSHAVSEQVHPPYTMLGGTVNQATTSSEPPFRPSSRSTSQPSQLETGSSRSASTANTPTSATVPPSTSTNLPPRRSHEIPAYINAQSHAFTQPPSGPSAVAPSADDRSTAAPMTDHPAPPSTHHHSAHPRQDPAGEGQETAYHARGPSGLTATAAASGWTSSPSSPRLHPTHRSTRSLGNSEASSPSRIKVRDLSHIQSFASEEFLAQSQRSQGSGEGGVEVGRQYEISSMPVTDIIEMVAGLLTKITTTNDLQHENLHRHIPPPDGTTALSPQATSVLAFHGKNVPSITILNYLSRIHKYCPTTYEVFLSLLVYFDRMTETVNRDYLQRLRRRAQRTVTVQPDAPRPPSSGPQTPQRSRAQSSMVTPPSSTGMSAQDPKSPTSSIPPSLQLQEDDDGLSHFFVVDSFNIHRLVIAGVTCASKFFSDVFYTNSRYAKVGGLPLVELNHLELQFLLLNDFRLSVPVEELEAYGTMLVEFYAREVVAQQQQAALAAAGANPSGTQGSHNDMRPNGGSRSVDTEVRQTPTPP